jgi:WD40 repeat protein
MSFPPIHRQNIVSLTEVARLNCAYITQVAWSPDGTLLAVAHNALVGIWRGFGGEPDLLLRGHEAPVKTVAFHPHLPIVATGSSDTTIRLWNSATGIQQSGWKCDDVSIERLAFSLDGSALIAGASDGSVRRYTLANTDEIAVLHRHEAEVTGIAFAPPSLFASSSRDHTLVVVNESSGIQHTLRHADWVRAFAWNAGGTHIASACKDGKLSLWDSASGEQLWAVSAHKDGVDSVAFSPDGTLIVSGGRDTALKLWDTQSGSLLQTLHGHSKPVLTLAFHPNGQFIVSGSGDNSVRLWGCGESD